MKIGEKRCFQLNSTKKNAKYYQHLLNKVYDYCVDGDIFEEAKMILKEVSEKLAEQEAEIAMLRRRHEYLDTVASLGAHDDNDNLD